MVLGLDISTSVTGWAILASDGFMIDIGHIDFKKCNTIWEKVDKALLELTDICALHKPVCFFIEESLQGFRPGFSSAATLLLLAKFNGLLSYKVRELLKIDPVYISSSEARKLCGIKLLQKKKHPRALGHKEQTFEHVSSTFLKDKIWVEKRFADQKKHLVDRVMDFCLDECDAFVIAKAGLSKLNKSSVEDKISNSVHCKRENTLHRGGVRKGRRSKKPEQHTGCLPDMQQSETDKQT